LVNKGETIAKIARKYQTSVSVLLKLNSLKLRDPLYVGRKLRLPQPLP
jgi:N-acetylmuramoyl-L-alanine amidase